MQPGQPILSDNAASSLKKYAGLLFQGEVTTFISSTECKVAGLAGLGGDDFVQDFYLWVVWDSGGAGAAPQKEYVRITSYTDADGTIVHNPLTTNLALGDKVLVMHPILFESLHGGDGSVGDIEIFDSFEYPTVAALRSKWVDSGGASDPVLDNATSYEGQYSIQTVITGTVGSLSRVFPTRNIKTLFNIGVASYSTVGGETVQFRVYDSDGNYSYWNITLAAATTWKYHNINPHSAPTGNGGTPADISDIVEIQLANLTIGSTFNFDFIKFGSLVASKIGLGYDGLSDTANETSSIRGHLLFINDNIEVPAKDATTDALARDVVGKKEDDAQTTVGTTRSIIAYIKGILNQIAAILANQSGAETISSTNLPDDVAENTIIEVVTTKRLRLESVWLNFTNLVQDVTIKVYHNDIDYDTFSWAASEENGVLIRGPIAINSNWKLTVTSTVAQGAIKAIPYNVISTTMEA